MPQINVKICKNLESDASAEIMNKVQNAKWYLEGMINSGTYPIGEYVIARKRLRSSQPTKNFSSTGIWGHSYKQAIKENLNANPQWKGDFARLWVCRTDKKPVFKTTKGNDEWYLALSTATDHMFTSDGD